MAGKSDAYEFNFLQMTFAGKPITNVCATGGSTLIWAGLHTADPGDAGSTAAEGGYTAYTRISVDRSTGGWVVTSGTSAAVATCSPVATINFPQVATTSTGTFSFMSVYPSSTSLGADALYSGTVTPNINFSQNVTPQITTGSSVTEE
jgi:hypothetical protein